jgi:hypothetical protein
MEKKDALSKILAIIGTVLVWIPILAPVVLGFVSLGMDGVYRFDYLMPAELGLSAFAGGALLLWAAIRAKTRRGIIAWGLGIAAGSITVLMAFGDVEPDSLEWAIAVGLLISYSLAIVAMDVGGVLLWKDLFEK